MDEPGFPGADGEAYRIETAEERCPEQNPAEIEQLDFFRVGGVIIQVVAAAFFSLPVTATISGCHRPFPAICFEGKNRSPLRRSAVKPSLS